MSNASPKRTLASNTRHARRTRLITWVCTVSPVAAYFASSLDPAMIVLVPFGALFAAGMHLFCACYVTLLELEGDTLIIHTARVGSPTHRIAVERIARKEFTEYGRMGSFASAEQPLIKLYIEGKRLPFMIDAGIEVLDLDAIKSLGTASRRPSLKG